MKPRVGHPLGAMKAISYVASVLVASTAIACGSASAGSTSVATTSTPMRTTLAWFAAINAKDARKARSYFTPGARYMMGWGPSSRWSTFSKLHCGPVSRSRTQASVHCAFHESWSPSEGNPDTWWNVDLRRLRGRWLIDNYGQP